MTKELCIVHANCQGEPLVERLLTSPEFAARFECEIHTNYTRQPVPGERLDRCALFLHQYLGPEWGELASASLLERLPRKAASLCVPNMFFKGYWPTWSGRTGFDFRCERLDQCIAMGLSPEETVLFFLHSDPGEHFDLLDLVGKSITRERERETRTPVKYLDLIIDNYRDVRLFNTVNHPGRMLMDHAARGVLAQLGLAAPDEDALARLNPPFADFEQPVNPRVARFFGWDFARTDTKYRIYGRRMTFAQFTVNYVMAAKAGESDFIGFLQGDSVVL